MLFKLVVFLDWLILDLWEGSTSSLDPCVRRSQETDWYELLSELEGG